MVQFRPQAREIIGKIVYYGPPLGGKTTNLRTLHEGYPPDSRGALTVVPTGGDRTIFFDLLPIYAGKLRGMDLRIQLYTVPGQVHYNATRQVVLRGVDGVVFVADSQRELLHANQQSWENLKENLLLQGLDLAELPHVIQYNKRDLADILPVEELNAALNEFNAPFFESVATVGIGVEDTLKAAVKLVVRSLRDRFNIPLEAPLTQPVVVPPPRPAPRGGGRGTPAVSDELAGVTQRIVVPPVGVFGGKGSESLPAPPPRATVDGGASPPREPFAEVLATPPPPEAVFGDESDAAVPGEEASRLDATEAAVTAVSFAPEPEPFPGAPPLEPAPLTEEIGTAARHDETAAPLTEALPDVPSVPAVATTPPEVSFTAPATEEGWAEPKEALTPGPESADSRENSETDHEKEEVPPAPLVTAAFPDAEPFPLDETPFPDLPAPEPPAAGDVFALAPAPPREPEQVERVVLGEVQPRIMAALGNVRELELEIPVPAKWIGGRRMTVQLRLTLVPQQESGDE